MANILLIHGAWHGAWCWYKLLPALRDRGLAPEAIDLPGHGDDDTPPTEVCMSGYVDHVVRAIRTYDEPVTLVGHSMGGMVIAAAAEEIPENLHALVFLNAMLPRNRESLVRIEQRNPKPVLEQNLLYSDNGATTTVAPDAVQSLFYHDCTAEEVIFARSNMGPQAMRVFSEPVVLSETRYGSVPRFYIECIDDRAVSVELQRDMQRSSPCADIVSLRASHFAFVSQPDAVADALTGFIALAAAES